MRSNRRVLLVLASAAVLMTLAERTALHRASPAVVDVRSEFMTYYNGVMDGSVGGPFAYRILVPYTICTPLVDSR